MPRVARFVLLVAVAVGAVVACGDDSSSTFGLGDTDVASADHRYVIPAGSGAAIDAGEPLEILPADLTVAVGDVIEIVNEDDRGHLVGPFFVGADEALRQEFTTAGTFEGICTVHPSGQIVLTVE